MGLFLFYLRPLKLIYVLITPIKVCVITKATETQVNTNNRLFNLDTFLFALHLLYILLICTNLLRNEASVHIVL